MGPVMGRFEGTGWGGCSIRGKRAKNFARGFGSWRKEFGGSGRCCGHGVWDEREERLVRSGVVVNGSRLQVICSVLQLMDGTECGDGRLW